MVKPSRITSLSEINPFSQVSVRAMMQTSLKDLYRWHRACRISILLWRDQTFARMMEGRGVLKGLLLILLQIPPCFPLFLGQSSGGKATAGLMLLGEESCSDSRSAQLLVSNLPSITGCTMRSSQISNCVVITRKIINLTVFAMVDKSETRDETRPKQT